MRCELSLQPLSAIQPFPESRPLLEAVQAGSNVWDGGAKRTIYVRLPQSAVRCGTFIF